MIHNWLYFNQKNLGIMYFYFFCYMAIYIHTDVHKVENPTNLGAEHANQDSLFLNYCL